MNEFGIIATILTFFITLLSFFLAIRIEIRKNNDRINEGKFLEEKRLLCHEQRMSILEERLSYIESNLIRKLEDINESINELRKQFINHLEDSHFE
jgi:hypothetical protein